MRLNVIDRGFVYTEAPFPACHASSVARFPDGSLVCVWFGGTHEKHPDVGIWLSRKPAKGVWSAPESVAKIAEVAHWNPVVFAAPDHRLHLWFKVGASIPHWKTWTRVSDDGGVSWSAPHELVPGDESGGRGPVKNKPILLSDGAWLAGASSEQGSWDAFIDRSDDSGATWQATPKLDRQALGEKHGIIQPTLWESAPGHVHAMLRSSCGVIPRADSVDGGWTWTPVYKTDVPNNNSGIDVVRTDSGALALICNPVGDDWGARSPLSILLSGDNGATWTHAIDLEDEPGAEFSYPAIIAHGSELVATYTWKRTRIAWAKLALG